MKKRPSLTPKQTLVAAIILLVFTLLVLFIKSQSDTQGQFDRLTDSFFRKQMTASTLDMHYTLAHPENCGITSYESTLPFYNAAQEQKQQLYLENLLNTLEELDERELQQQDQYLLKLWKQSLSATLDMTAYPYYQEPLSPAGGMHTQLPILLAEYTFRSTRDVEDYLSLLSQIDDYFQSLLQYETEKKEAGLFMAASSLDKVIEQCDTIVTNEEIMTGSHFLQTSFMERLEELTKQADLDETTLESYRKENDELLKTVVLPAYQSLASGLFLLRDEHIPLEGLAAKENGADYYKYLLISRVGSYTPPEDIKKMYISQLQQEFQALYTLLTENEELSQTFLQQTYWDLPLEEPVEILADLQNRMSKDFPSYLLGGQQEPTVYIKEVAENLQPYSAPAFYLTVPFDDCSTNAVYINNSSAFSDLELYTTLAHETFPGHLYQTVFCNRFSVENQENPVRQLLWYGGYLEGWALYTEFVAYDYASDMLKEEHRLSDALCVEMEKHNRSMQLCLYALLDYIIHYENATPGDLIPYLEPFGVTDIATINSVYEYIVEDPCNYPQYYLGYLEICKLKELAIENWGSTYTDYRFHSFLLEQGPADFATLTEELNQSSSLLSLGYHTFQIAPIPQ